MSTNRRLDQRRLLEGVRVLRRRDRDLGAIVRSFGPPPLWDRPQTFGTLVHIILEQQVSLASARAAFDKLLKAASPLTPRSFLKLRPRKLRAVGFSGQKAGYCRGLAQAIDAGELDLARLSRFGIERARQSLLALKGVGPWTADIYLLMAQGRPDIWPRGDLALLKAAQEVKGLAALPSAEEFEEMGEAWRPWRSVAARLLWHQYLATRRNGDGSSS